jgi:Ca2+-binding RTX toxin-like protein
VSLGSNADIFTSGAANDTVTGGGGLDEFHFNITTNAGNTDVITDFAVDTDVIVIEGGSGSLTYLGDDSGWTSSGSAEARFVTSTNLLEIDTDGNGAADLNIKLTNITAGKLSETDITWSV